MKTLKQFQEATGYLKVKSPDEQKFVDKHEVETMDDQNGNGDEVFKASKVKKVARKAERKGYEPGEDESVYEEAEQIDELSRATVGRYSMKAKSIADNEGGKDRSKGRELAGRKKWGGTMSGVPKAKVMASEEAEQIEESAVGRYNDVHASTKDLLKKINTHLSTHKMNASKSKNYKGEKGPHWGHVEHMKDIHRTLSDIHDRLAQQGEYAMHEEVEQVDEISKATMGRYINKAKDSIDMTSYRSGIKDGTAISSSTPYKSNNPLEKKLSKRHKGIETAVKKLTKEETDYLINRYADFKENISALAPRLQEALHDVLDRLNEENQDVFMTSCQTEEGLEKMVAFAIENRGE